MKLHRDFKEFLSLLLSHQVRFLVVGAHALAVHGRPRYTGDLDIFIDPTKANAKRLLLALSRRPDSVYRPRPVSAIARKNLSSRCSIAPNTVPAG